MTTPTTYPPFSPYLTVRDASKAIDFYKAAFGATELFRLTMGKTSTVCHAELMLNGSLIMLCEEFPGMNKSPETLGGSPMTFCVMVADADAGFAQALAAGATELKPMADQFYGFRSGAVTDPFGHQWMIQHQIEAMSPEVMQQRMNAMIEGCQGES